MAANTPYTHGFITSFLENPNATLEDKLRFIEFVPMNVWIGYQLDAVILFDIMPSIEAEDDVDDALLIHISKRLLKCFGSIAMQSCCTTLVDSIEWYHYNEDEESCGYCKSKITCLQMAEAMAAAGFLRTNELSEFTVLEGFLITMGKINKEYGHESDYWITGIPYDELRKKHDPLTEDLARYLYHPKKLESWLLANPEKHVEDYMP